MDVFSGALSICDRGIQACFSWLNTIFTRLDGGMGFFIAMFAIYCAFRFLLMPLFSGARLGSDKVKRTKNDSSSKTQSDNMEG